jgi:BirA family biotin operon repressor/biotin-[acetyl-CoA-carboxylase] ligase
MASDVLSPEIIQSRLTTREIGRNLVYRRSVTSTMDVALEQVSLGAPGGTAVVAEMQENGKGRLNRNWISPAGGVYVSIVLYPQTQLVNSLTMIASLAVCDCIRETSGVEAKIKWPNDILLGGEKVGGILACSGTSPSQGAYAVVGIGINADLDLDKYPEIAGIAASLAGVSGKNVSRRELLCSLLGNLEKRYDRLSAGESQIGEWRAALVTIGQPVTVKTGGLTFTGTAESVDCDGSLLLRLEHGGYKIVPAGDVTLRA